jgi:hypothetical protein
MIVSTDTVYFRDCPREIIRTCTAGYTCAWHTAVIYSPTFMFVLERLVVDLHTNPAGYTPPPPPPRRRDTFFLIFLSVPRRKVPLADAGSAL